MEELVKHTPNDVELGRKVRKIINNKDNVDVKGLNITFNGVPISHKELEILSFNKTRG